MFVQFPLGPTISTDPPLHPVVIMGDGARHQTRPTVLPLPPPPPGNYPYIKAEFWKYTVDGHAAGVHLLEMPNGYRVTFKGTSFGLIDEATDPFGNKFTFFWETTGAGAKRLTDIHQSFGETFREVRFTYNAPEATHPRQMLFDGKTWTYNFQGANLVVESPRDDQNNPLATWVLTHPNDDTLEVTTPSGGRIDYGFGIHAFSRDTYPDPANGQPVITNRKVLISRHVRAGRGLNAAAWTYQYDTPEPQQTTVTYVLHIPSLPPDVFKLPVQLSAGSSVVAQGF